MKRGLLATLAFAALLVLLATRSWDSPQLGRALLDGVGERTGMTLLAEGSASTCCVA